MDKFDKYVSKLNKKDFNNEFLKELNDCKMDYFKSTNDYFELYKIFEKINCDPKKKALAEFDYSSIILRENYKKIVSRIFFDYEGQKKLIVNSNDIRYCCMALESMSNKNVPIIFKEIGKKNNRIKKITGIDSYLMSLNDEEFKEYESEFEKILLETVVDEEKLRQEELKKIYLNIKKYSKGISGNRISVCIEKIVKYDLINDSPIPTWSNIYFDNSTLIVESNELDFFIEITEILDKLKINCDIDYIELDDYGIKTSQKIRD